MRENPSAEKLGARKKNTPSYDLFFGGSLILYTFGISALKNVVFTGILGDFKNNRFSTTMDIDIYTGQPLYEAWESSVENLIFEIFGTLAFE